MATTDTETATQGTGHSAGQPAARRWLIGAAWLLGAAVLFVCYLRLASTRAVNSDGATQALQAWDMLHGNLRLHGWGMRDVSFYTTELPQYLLIELVRGLNANVVHVAAAMTYTLVVVIGGLLAVGRATGRAALARVLVTVGIMLAPQLAVGTNVLLSSPDHIGTTVPVLVVWLILDRARPRWYVPVLAGMLLAWATVADTLVLFIGVLPLALVGAIRAYRSLVVQRKPLESQWYDLCLCVSALAGGLAGQLALHLIRSHGGFVMWAPVTQLLANGSDLPHSLGVTAEGLLILGGADFLGRQLSVGTALLMLHLAGVLLAGWATALAARRFFRGVDLVDQVLVVAVVINVAAFALSSQSSSAAYTREIAAVLPFAAVLAGRLLAERLVALRLAPVLLVVLAGYLAGLTHEVAQPSAPAQNQQLVSWLAAHRLRTGLSGYWESNVVTLASSDEVQIRSVKLSPPGKRLISDLSHSNAAWYDPHRASANFVVLARTPASRGSYYPGAPTDYPGFTDESAVLATFGPPAHVYHVGLRYEVLVWNKNLLRDLG